MYTDGTTLESSAYSRRSCKLVQLVNTLRDAGAHIDLSLPCLVVCGNQSVGKSSLIEAICGISLPKASGTCTRCVTEVRLSDNVDAASNSSSTINRTESSHSTSATTPTESTTASDPSKSNWSCSISLRFEFDDAGLPLRTIREVPFGPALTNKALVPLSVRRAQKALLNPASDPASFLLYEFNDQSQTHTDADARANHLKFSKNIVCLDIQGAGINLSLVDLPGIIRNVEIPEETLFIAMIEDLVRSYIAQERTIIVATITCKDEVENQAIVHLAREVDPTGSRTIGVLTKPDTIETGTAGRWIEMLTGNEYPLKLGYFMVRCLTKAELATGKSFEEARQLEESFFSHCQPWASMRRKSNNRFGVPALRIELNRLLTNLVDMSLPHIKSLTETAIGVAIAELGQIPPALGDNARIELLQMIRHYCTLVTLNINAQNDFKLFYQKVRGCFETLRDRIVATRPQFDLERKGYSATSSHSSGNGSGVHSGSDSNSPSQVIPPSTPPSSGRRDTTASSWSAAAAAASSFSLASSISMVIPNRFLSTLGQNAQGSNSPPLVDPLASKRTHSPRPAKSSAWNASDAESCQLNLRRPLTLGDLQRIVNAQKGRELNGYSPYGAFTFLVATCQGEWQKFAVECLTNVSQELGRLLFDLTEQVFGRFANLQSQLRLFTQMFQNELQRVTLEQINHLVAMECRHPFTLSSSAFTDRKARYLYILSGQMEGISNTGVTASVTHMGGNGNTTTPQRPTAEEIRRVLVASADEGLLGTSIMGGSRSSSSTFSSPAIDESILNLVASTLAYMEIAIGRIGDMVPMTIEYHFMSRFGEMLEKELVSQLGVLDGEVGSIEVLLKEDWGVAERRADIELRRDRLETVWRSLHHFGI
ncbi:hypothetical protein BASA61_004546 [Batrachochytrium salamandrivorans]|nr:hypothetical protein BASA61_004546 [Batrachochytrium salamandrivorans]